MVVPPQYISACSDKWRVSIRPRVVFDNRRLSVKHAFLILLEAIAFVLAHRHERWRGG